MTSIAEDTNEVLAIEIYINVCDQKKQVRIRKESNILT